MKQYLLFAGDNYYPAGGWDDFIDSFDEPEDAVIAGEVKETHYGITHKKYDWYHIIDSKTGKPFTYDDN